MRSAWSKPIVPSLGMDDVLLFGLRANSATPDAFEVVGTTLQVEPYGYMVRKGDAEFKKLADDTSRG